MSFKPVVACKIQILYILICQVKRSGMETWKSDIDRIASLQFFLILHFLYICGLGMVLPIPCKSTVSWKRCMVCHFQNAEIKVTCDMVVTADRRLHNCTGIDPDFHSQQNLNNQDWQLHQKQMYFLTVYLRTWKQFLFFQTKGKCLSKFMSYEVWINLKQLCIESETVFVRFCIGEKNSMRCLRQETSNASNHVTKNQLWNVNTNSYKSRRSYSFTKPWHSPAFTEWGSNSSFEFIYSFVKNIGNKSDNFLKIKFFFIIKQF